MSNDWKETLITNFTKPATVSVSTSFGSYLLGLKSGGYLNNNVNIMGFSVPMYLYSGITSFGTTLITESVHNWVFEQIDGESAYSEMLEMLLKPTLNVVVGVGFIYLFNPELIRVNGYMPLIVLFGAGYMVGDYMNNSLIEPWLQDAFSEQE